MQLPVTTSIVQQIYIEGKFWIGLGGGLWSVFKIVDWFKTIKTNDLHHIQLGINDVKEGLEQQTGSIVDELREMRADFRTYAMMGKITEK